LANVTSDIQGQINQLQNGANNPNTAYISSSANNVPHQTNINSKLVVTNNVGNTFSFDDTGNLSAVKIKNNSNTFNVNEAGSILAHELSIPNAILLDYIGNITFSNKLKLFNNNQTLFQIDDHGFLSSKTIGNNTNSFFVSETGVLTSYKIANNNFSVNELGNVILNEVLINTQLSIPNSFYADQQGNISFYKSLSLITNSNIPFVVNSSGDVTAKSITKNIVTTNRINYNSRNTSINIGTNTIDNDYNEVIIGSLNKSDILTIQTASTTNGGTFNSNQYLTYRTRYTQSNLAYKEALFISDNTFSFLYGVTSPLQDQIDALKSENDALKIQVGGLEINLNALKDTVDTIKRILRI
jgi:hypothetical protein